MKYVLAFALLALSACLDQTLTAHSVEGDWVLREMNGQPFMDRATMSVGSHGEVSGQGPCNHYRGDQTASYPEFAVTRVGATHMACENLSSEDSYFDALMAMSHSEVIKNTLILRNESGEELVFTRP